MYGYCKWANNGSITVFLSLSFTIMIALICTTMETVRIDGLNTHLDMVADSAVDSLFASYDRELMDKYGLLFLDGSGGNLEYSDSYLKNEIKEYMKYGLSPKLGGIGLGSTIYPMSFDDIRILNTVRATDFGGNVLEQEIIDYMKYKEVGDITEKLFGWKSQIEGKDDGAERIEDAKEQLNGTNWGETKRTAKLNVKDYNIIKNPATQTELSEGSEAIESPFDSERYKEEIEKSIIHQAEEVKKGGFLKLIIPNGMAVSGAKLEEEDLPSLTSVTESKWENKNLPEKAARTALYGEYLLEHCANFRSDAEKAGLRYEIEYILFGKNSDEENLKSCINRLLWIREGFNIAHIFSSPRKMEEALTLATAIVGWTMIPPLITAAQIVIVGAWAYAEALLDVRRIFNGKKVGLIKTEETWQLGLNGIKDFFNGALNEEKDDDSGLSYEDYIRVLLVMMNQTEKFYRTMDIIQQNMRQTAPNFQMKNYIYSVEVCVEAEAKQLFLMFPGVRSIIGRKSHNYRIITAVGRSY